MLDPVSLAFLATGLVISLGFLGELFFRRTGIPDAVFLLLFGVVLGPLLRIFDGRVLMPIAPYFAALALIIILFDGGLHMNLEKVIKGSPRAASLAIIGFLLSAFSTGVFCKFLLGWRWLNGFLLGGILGGSSSIIVMTIVGRMGISEETATVLSLESALTDVLCAVATFTIISIVLPGEVNLWLALRFISAAFTVGAAVGLLSGVLWLFMLQKVHGKPNAYMLTLAFLLIVYMLAETLGGAGALSALFFGLVLGNGPYVSKVLGFETTPTFDGHMVKFHGEISFLIRTFFYVFIGLLVSLTSINPILLGIALSFIFLGVRAIAVKAAAIGTSGLKERTVMTIMLPRGLAAAVLSLIPMTKGIPGAEIFPEITFTVILTTVAICTIGIGVSPEARLPKGSS